MTFSELGWWQPFDLLDYFRAEFPESWIPARVSFSSHEEFQLLSPSGSHQGVLSGRIRFEAEEGGAWPVVGDWAAVLPNGNGPWVIQLVLPRSSTLYRGLAERGEPDQIMAANVDVALILSALDNELNTRRLERYLYLVGASRIRPIIVLNKADLHSDLEQVQEVVRKVCAGADVHVISAQTGAGVDELSAAIQPAQTAVLLGSSGVGKSTLLNRLIGAEQQRTSPVRESDSKGRHTTTHRQLIPMPLGWVMIDMPGIREVGLPGGEESRMESAFPEIEAWSAECRFPDCSHVGEPGCRVLEAIEMEELQGDRLASYQKFLREIAFQHRRGNKQAELQEKARWKTIHKEQRKIYKKGKHL